MNSRPESEDRQYEQQGAHATQKPEHNAPALLKTLTVVQLCCDACRSLSRCSIHALRRVSFTITEETGQTVFASEWIPVHAFAEEYLDRVLPMRAADISASTFRAPGADFVFKIHGDA